MAKTVVGLFDDFTQAQNVVQDLVNAGFRRDDISIAANQTASGYDADTLSTTDTSGSGHAVGKDAGIGAGIGGALGLVAGLGLLTIPGVGIILAAGPLASALGIGGVLGSTLSGAVVGGVVGGLVGALTHIGVPKEHAEYYTEGVRRGGTLVTLNAPDDRAEEAVNILNGHGAVDIDDRANDYKTGGYTGYTETAPAYTARKTSPASAACTAAARRARSRRTARRSSRSWKRNWPSASGRCRAVALASTRSSPRPPCRSRSRCTRSTSRFERNAVNRAVTGADATFKEGTIELTETAEVPVISKEARVVEEVVVGKTATDRVETVSDTVRRTDVDVEEIPGATTTTDTTTSKTSY